MEQHELRFAGGALDQHISAIARQLYGDERSLVWLLSNHRGAANPIRSAAILDQLGLRRGENGRRWVNGAVAHLLELGLRIGASRRDPVGYFLIETQADLDIALSAHRGQLYGHIRHMRLLASKQTVAQMFGQAMLEFEKGATAA